MAAFAIAIAAAALFAGGLVSGGTAMAQQNQQWFVPGQQQQQQQRPAQAQRGGQAQPQRPGRPPAPIIGIVSVPDIMRSSVAAQGVQRVIEERRLKLNDDAQREQEAWRQAQQALISERATLTPEQLRERERQLQERINNAQRIFRERTVAIQRVGQEALAKVEEELANIVRQLAQERGLNMVLHRNLVILNYPEFEITDVATQRLNERLRSVPVPEGG